jgi:predicted nucleic acid-binding protein
VDLIIDTQILSYRFKGVEANTHNTRLAIASITANEFLVAQAKESEQPDYYTIHPARYPNLEYSANVLDHFGNPKSAKLGARRTDRIIIDFGTQFSAYREFGNEAISEIINAKKLDIYKISIAHLSKQRQKYLLSRLKYILDNDYYCYSLNKTALAQALSLFSEFTSQHNCKGNIRNTINDLLILATAIDRGKRFLTNDNLLARFAAEYYEAPIHECEDELLIDFSEKQVERRKSKESKGYINKGWSYAMRNNRTHSET